MLKRLAEIARYNRDWHLYVLGRFSPPKDGEVLNFRLRNGQRLALKSETRFLLNEIYLDRVYDLPGVDYSKCTKVLDLGGNVGLFALYVASRNARAEIYSFEPSSENLSLLRRNLEANPEHARRIKVLPFAVGSSCKTVPLYLSGTPAEYSTVGESRELAQKRSGAMRGCCIHLWAVRGRRVRHCEDRHRRRGARTSQRSCATHNCVVSRR